MRKQLGKDAGIAFRERLESGKILQMVGVYDVFSALLASQHFEGIFCSGFSFAASTYGLPDIGFVNWRDIVDFARRIRYVLPNVHLMVDIDDGFGDEIVAENTVYCLECDRISAVILEDQKRPRRCGHAEGKKVLSVEEYLAKLKYVREKRRKELFVIARTDAPNPEVGIERAIRYAEAGADGVLVEAISSLEVVQKLKNQIDCPIVVNQLHGGKSPNWTNQELEKAGASIVVYSTSCLFAAHYGIENYLEKMRQDDQLPKDGTVSMDVCNTILNRGSYDYQKVRETR